MNELQIFNFQDYAVRVIEVAGEPWWVLKDLCEVLELSNPTMVSDRLDEDERSKLNLGRQGETNIVNESGLYSVILRSDKPKAKIFKKWVTSTVLPSIRKTGSYSILEQKVPTTFLEALKLAVEKEEKILLLENEKSVMKPKVEKYDKFLDAEGLYSMEEMAKTFVIGRNTLLKALRENKIFTRKNLPYQNFMKYFKIVCEEVNGFEFFSAKVTPEGFEFLIQKLTLWGML